MINQLIDSMSLSSPTASTINFDSSNFIISEIKGLESPVTRLSKFDLPGVSGAFISNALYGARAISVKGTLNAGDGTIATYFNNRTSLVDALAYSRDSSGNLQPQTLTITLTNGQVLTSKVYVDKALTLPYAEDQVDWADFLITLIAPDPNLYSQNQVSTTINLRTGTAMTAIGIPFQTVGSGQHDLTSGGTFTDTQQDVYTIVIQAGGASFQWKKNSGSFSTTIAITGTAQTLSDGVTVTFGHTSGYTNGDTFTITATYGLPTAVPLSLGAGSGGTAVIDNTGAVEVFPVITLNAPLTNPYITNQRTGQFIQILYTLNPGDVALTIDCSTGTVMQGANNRIGTMTSESSFWGMLSGNNTIGFSASAGTGTANVAFSPVFLGI